MAINKKLIHFSKKENFLTEVANGNILDYSIVFIQDSKEIYTHGTFYSTNKSDSEIEDIVLNSSNISEMITNISEESSKIPLQTVETDNLILKPNIYYKLTTFTNLNVTLEAPDNSEIVNEYFLEFQHVGTNITFPNTLKWMNGEVPTFENGKTYQVSIINNLAISAMFE